VGRRFDIDMGDRITVVGKLHVVERPPAVVNRVLVPAWTEIAFRCSFIRD
jgi:hypothetical protein